MYMATNVIDSRYLGSSSERLSHNRTTSSGISGGILLAFRAGIPTDSALVIYFTFRENEKGGVLCKLELRWKSVLQSEHPAACGRSTLEMDKDLAKPSEDRSTGRAVSWEIYRMPVSISRLFARATRRLSRSLLRNRRSGKFWKWNSFSFYNQPECIWRRWNFPIRNFSVKHRWLISRRKEENEVIDLIFRITVEFHESRVLRLELKNLWYVVYSDNRW